MKNRKINRVVLTAHQSYVVFFDNIRVDQFVKDYNVSIGLDSNIASASINMTYVPDLDKVIHDTVSSVKVSDKSKKDVSAPKTEQVKKVKIVNCSTLTVRSQPLQKSNAIEWVKAGEILTYHGNGGDNNYWINVTTPSGKKGWIGGDFATIFSENKAVKTDIASQSASKPDSSQGVVKINDGISLTVDDGIENMTNVRIYVMNIFTRKYVQIFGGNIRTKATSISPDGKTLTFHASGPMEWLNRTICPIAVPMDQTLSAGDRLRWSAQGIKIENVRSVNSSKDIHFKGKSLLETWDTVSNQAIKSNKLYSDPNTVAKWDDAIGKVVIMGDIDPNLRKAEVMDFMISSSMTQVNSVYILMNDIAKMLMFEFFDDRDETIRVKPPFWNEHVIQNHIIDPSLILNYTESTNYANMYTRVVATGAIDEWWYGGDNTNAWTSVGDSGDGLSSSLLTPVAAVTSSGIMTNSGPQKISDNPNIQVPNYESNYPQSSNKAQIAATAAQICIAQVGKPYVWGAAGPSSFDCSGLIDYAYRQAGYAGFGKTRMTTRELIKFGSPVTSYNDLKAGDVIFENAGHVGIYVGNQEIVLAENESVGVKKYPLKSRLPKAYSIRRITENSGASIVTSIPQQVGPSSLLEPTEIERKYGPLVYECSQPAIKFSTSQYIDDSKNAYDALGKYSKFMLNYLTTSCLMSTLTTTVPMPWLRPGMNVWVDPIMIDKVFYINSINHSGNASGNYTSLGLTLGRRREDFVNNTCSIGGLNPGKSDDVFVSTIKQGADKLGLPCDYNDIIQKMQAFYFNTFTDINEEFRNSAHFNHLYGKVTPKPKEKTVQGMTVSTIGKAVLRSSAHVDTKNPMANIICYLESGVQVTVVGEKNEWSNVSCSQGSGWILTTSLSGSKSASNDKKGIVVNISTKINVRSGPGTKYPEIGNLFLNDVVTINSVSGDWTNIKWKNGTAWVSSKFIKEQSSAPAQSQKDKITYSTEPKGTIGNNEMSINEIQQELNKKYSSAPSVVKARSQRLMALVSASNDLMKNMYASNYTDKPVNVVSGKATI